MYTVIDKGLQPGRNSYMTVKKPDGNNPKCLIAYFSRPGNNYVNGTIVNLPVGNTEVIAKMIQEMTSGDLLHIEVVNAYPGDYTETTEVAKEELRTSARPKLTNHLENMASYDMIFLGYPNWWGTMPMPVYTFLEEHNFSGKTIVPFCTHEGSGLGRSVADIKKTCPTATVFAGLAIKGGDVNNAQGAVSGWLREL
jgi:flavodoxin